MSDYVPDLRIIRWDGYANHSVAIRVCETCKAIVTTDDFDEHLTWHRRQVSAHLIGPGAIGGLT